MNNNNVNRNRASLPKIGEHIGVDQSQIIPVASGADSVVYRVVDTSGKPISALKIYDDISLDELKRYGAMTADIIAQLQKNSKLSSLVTVIPQGTPNKIPNVPTFSYGQPFIIGGRCNDLGRSTLALFNSCLNQSVDTINVIQNKSQLFITDLLSTISLDIGAKVTKGEDLKERHKKRFIQDTESEYGYA